MNQAELISSVWSFIVWGAVPALVVLTMVKYEKYLPWPFKQNEEIYFGMGVLFIAAYLLVWVLFAVTVEGDSELLFYVPVFKPVEFVQIFVMYSLLIWNTKQKDRLKHLKSNLPDHAFSIVYAAVAFMILNSIIARSVHNFSSVAYTWDNLLHSMTYQTSISVVWSLLALLVMITASRLNFRQLWFVGAGLLSLVVIKLFLVELSTTETITRIISFLVVGGLMLLIGYMSPLPPRSHAKKVK